MKSVKQVIRLINHSKNFVTRPYVVMIRDNSGDNLAFYSTNTGSFYLIRPKCYSLYTQN